MPVDVDYVPVATNSANPEVAVNAALDKFKIAILELASMVGGEAGETIPTGGTLGQLLARGSGGTLVWVDPPTGGGGEPIYELPEGGTTGQLLAKQSDVDYDVAWIDAPAGGTPGGADNSATTVVQRQIYPIGSLVPTYTLPNPPTVDNYLIGIQTFATTTTPPSGFTLIGSAPDPTSRNATTVWYRKVQSGDSPNLPSPIFSNGDTGSITYIELNNALAADWGDFFVNSAIFVGTGNGTVPPIDVTDGDFVLAFFIARQGFSVLTAGGGWTALDDENGGNRQANLVRRTYNGGGIQASGLSYTAEEVATVVLQFRTLN